jgi:hypothetical protein
LRAFYALGNTLALSLLSSGNCGFREDCAAARARFRRRHVGI